MTLNPLPLHQKPPSDGCGLAVHRSICTSTLNPHKVLQEPRVCKTILYAATQTTALPKPPGTWTTFQREQREEKKLIARVNRRAMECKMKQTPTVHQAAIAAPPTYPLAVHRS